MSFLSLVFLGLLALWLLACLYRYLRFRAPIGKYFSGKHVWIIGASSGLGEEMVMQLAPLGAELTISSRRQDVMEQLKKNILLNHPNAKITVVPLDVTNENQIEQVYERIKKEIREVDIVVYNSGINQNSVMTHELTPQAAMNVLSTNLIGAMNVIQRVVKDMKQRNAGHIVTISSLAAHRGLPESGIYGASKAGLSNYIESLRIELGVKYSGISFTVIQPGFVRTPILLHVKYELPLVMEVDKAVQLMLRAIKEQYPFYAFPLPLYYLQQFSHLVPCSLYDWIIRNAAKPKQL